MYDSGFQIFFSGIHSNKKKLWTTNKNIRKKIFFIQIGEIFYETSEFINII